MLRRHFLPIGTAGVIAFSLGSQLFSTETIAWGPTVKGLRLGMRLEEDKPNPLIVLVKNVASEPYDLYLFDGELARFQLIATSPEGRNYQLKDRELYKPCAGLCGFPPKVQRLEAGAILNFGFAPNHLLYVPNREPYTTLDVLFDQGYSVRAIFEMTEKALKESRLESELPWLGRVMSGEVRKH